MYLLKLAMPLMQLVFSVKVSLKAIIWEGTAILNVCVKTGKFMLTNIAVTWWHGFKFAFCCSG